MRVMRVLMVGTGLVLAFAGVEDIPQSPVALAEGPASFSSSREADGSELVPLAEHYLRAAKEQVERQREVERERQRAREREEAQRLAIQLSREKLKQRTLQEREAQRQLQTARDRQAKSLYQQGLALYRRGDYEEAASLLRQLALVNPAHPLVKAAEPLIAQAELKQFERRLRVSTGLPASAGGAGVAELEQLLTQKRIELEAALKYAKAAINDQRHDAALRLLTAILVQDPAHREARQLMAQTRMAMLREEQERAEQQVRLDEQAMVNEVIKAQRLPATPSGAPVSHRPSTAPRTALEQQLQVPISFDFTDVALSDILDFLADAANVSIIPSPQLDLQSKRVSLKVSQLPLEQAIKYLTKSLSLAYRVERDAVLVAAPEEFSGEPMETRVFLLRNGLGPFALETAAVQPNQAMGTESIQELIRQTIPQPAGSKLVVDERSGALIVTNTPGHLALVEQLLSQLDVTPLQVLIEARFVEVAVEELEQLGVESVLTGDYTLTKEKTAGGGRNPGNIVGKSSGFKFPDLARQSEGANLTLEGVLTALQFETVLHFLEELKKTKTLSAPRLTTLNHQAATIRVVEEFRYPTRYEVSLIQFDTNGDGDFDDAGETEFANVPQDFKQRDIGILLHVTPSVGSDLKTITLVLAPEVSQAGDFRNLGSGVTVPQFTSSQLTTSVVIEDGQTVVLGGLMKDQVDHQSTKIPVLGDLPLLGPLFRQSRDTSKRTNLLIFITARLLAPRGQTT